MKIMIELTGQEYRLIHKAVGLALQDAKKRRDETDRNEKPVTYANIDFEVRKYTELCSYFNSYSKKED